MLNTEPVFREKVSKTRVSLANLHQFIINIKNVTAT